MKVFVMISDGFVRVYEVKNYLELLTVSKIVHMHIKDNRAFDDLKESEDFVTEQFGKCVHSEDPAVIERATRFMERQITGITGRYSTLFDVGTGFVVTESPI